MPNQSRIKLLHALDDLAVGRSRVYGLTVLVDVNGKFAERRLGRPLIGCRASFNRSVPPCSALLARCTSPCSAPSRIYMGPRGQGMIVCWLSEGLYSENNMQCSHYGACRHVFSCACCTKTNVPFPRCFTPATPGLANHFGAL